MGKHTPGPWVKVGRLEVRAYGLVATVNEHNTINGEPEANASLIASAPDMLAWLKKQYTLCAPLSTHGRELETLIAKAEGRA